MSTAMPSHGPDSHRPLGPGVPARAGKFSVDRAARDPGKDYRSDAAGRILRRVRVKPHHFRCAGAAAVLKVAAEEGWTLDPAFPADPRRTLHLCRPDDGRSRKT
ncbi:hypothetical protein ACPC54_35525 [Kitasatospora sp. NPDC094028]